VLKIGLPSLILFNFSRLFPRSLHSPKKCLIPLPEDSIARPLRVFDDPVTVPWVSLMASNVTRMSFHTVPLREVLAPNESVRENLG
jgi:hypothetical protein